MRGEYPRIFIYFSICETYCTLSFFGEGLLLILSFAVVWYRAGTNVSDARKALKIKGFRASVMLGVAPPLL